jgi:hypothetical protein
MERWLKAAAVEAVPVDEQKVEDRATAVKAEMRRVWDATGTRDAMLKHIEEWLAYGAAPAGVKGCVLREELHPIMLAVYEEKYPEDFAPVDVRPGGLKELGGGGLVAGDGE